MAGDLTILQALLLGVIQGLTEWLPVSSSGHLVLAQHLLSIRAPLFFDLIIHVGTLLVVLVFYRDTVARVARALLAAPGDVRAGASWREALLATPERRLALLILVGSAPTAAIGFAFRDAFEALYANAQAVGAALVLMGTFLYLTKRVELPDPARPRPGPRAELTWRDALIVGAAQGAAIVPGLSRSGSTIGAALFLGVEREEAVQYSFLLSVPAILGATLFLLLDGAARDVAANPLAYAAGTLAAVVVGYAALAALVLIVKKRSFHHFAWYCWAVGGAVLAGYWWVGA